MCASRANVQSCFLSLKDDKKKRMKRRYVERFTAAHNNFDINDDDGLKSIRNICEDLRI